MIGRRWGAQLEHVFWVNQRNWVTNSHNNFPNWRSWEAEKSQVLELPIYVPTKYLSTLKCICKRSQSIDPKAIGSSFYFISGVLTGKDNIYSMVRDITKFFFFPHDYSSSPQGNTAEYQSVLWPVSNWFKKYSNPTFRKMALSVLLQLLANLGWWGRVSRYVLAMRWLLNYIPRFQGRVIDVFP